MIHISQISNCVDFIAALLLQARVDACKIVTHDATVELLHNEGFHAGISSSAGRKKTARASADHQKLRVNGFDNLIIGDVRGISDPVRGILRSRLRRSVC